MGGVDLSKGSANIADRLSKFDKSSLSPEQAEYFDSLVKSGYFADADGLGTKTPAALFPCKDILT